MEWTIRLMYAIILTSITGTILFGAWYGIGHILERMGFINIMYTILRTLLIFWCLPLAFVIIKHMNNQVDEGGGFLFFNTQMLKIISIILVFVWLFVVEISFVIYLWNIFVTYRKFSSSFDCGNELEEYFYDICDKLHIKRQRVKLRRSYKVGVPVCVGTFKPMVVLPVHDYTREELLVIFVHELTHYKHKDEWLKHFTFIVSCFHCFNPIMHFMKKKIDLWGEYSCDYDSIKIIGSTKQYFQVILDMTSSEDDKIKLYSPLFEKKSELERRIEQMIRSQEMIKKSKAIAAVCVLAMAITSTTSVYAATCVAEKAYMNGYNATVEEVYDISEVVTEDGLTEYEVSGLDASVSEEEGAVVARDRSGTSFNFGWNVPKKTAKRSAGFKVAVGDTINVTALCVPNTVTFRIGIVEPDGVRRYISGTNALLHIFTVKKAGTHYVYVQNMSTTKDVTINGAYSWN